MLTLVINIENEGNDLHSVYIRYAIITNKRLLLITRMIYEGKENHKRQE
jgi:hypothetical protein